MKIVHVHDVIRDVPTRFTETYANYVRDHRFPPSSAVGGRTIGEIKDALAAAGDDLAAIRAALPSWCEQSCDECGKINDVLIRFGEAPGYEARWQDLCCGCLTAGIRLAERCEAAQVER